MKRAVVAGLNMAGVHCHDLELAPVPVSRYYVRTRHSDGGITLRTAPHDPQALSITFVDRDGTDLEEGTLRKVERTYYREEFRRAYAGEVGELHYPPRATEYYAEGLLANIDAKAIREGRLKLVVDYAFGATSYVLPGVLGRLDCEVLAVNSIVDESRAVLSLEEVARHQARLADLVTVSGSDLGVLFDTVGERLFLVDDAGRICDSMVTLLLATDMYCRRGSGAVALPVTTSREVARLAERSGVRVRWTKAGTHALMGEAVAGRVGFAGAPDGSLIFPDLTPAPDGMLALAKLLEHIATTGQRLSELIDPLPEVHVAHEPVPCPWEQKGAVMREVMEQASGDRVELVDGVKVYRGADWVLVLPDPEHPLVHVWAEAGSTSGAGGLVGTQVQAIRTLIG
jgi:mannose-1-phosphate guanylyltransferase / phosphomannomutase